MPSFFIISGYFIREQHLKTCIKKNFQQYLLPLIVTAIISLAILLFHDYLNKEAYTLTFSAWLIQLYTMNYSHAQSYEPWITCLWFLFAMFWGTTIFSQIKKLNNSNQLILACCCGVLAFVLRQKGHHLPLSIEEGLLSVFFLYIGSVLNKTKFVERKEISKVSIVFMFSMWVLSIPYGPFYFKTLYFSQHFFTIFGAIAGSILFLLFCYIIKFNIILNWVGRNTLCIFCGHIISVNLLNIKEFPYLFRYSSINLIAQIMLYISVALILGWFLLGYTLGGFLGSYFAEGTALLII